MIFLYDNVLDEKTVVAGTCESGYEVANIQDHRLSRVYRSTGSSSEYVGFDLGDTDIPINYVAIAAHNLTTGATITFQASSSSEFGGGTSTGLTHDDNIIMQAVTATTKRYVRFYFDDTGSTEGYVEIGRLSAGCKLGISVYSQPEIDSYLEDTSVASWSVTGQLYGDERITYRIIEGIDSPILKSSDKAMVETMYETVKRTKPLFLLVYPSATNEVEALYCAFEDPPKFSHIDLKNWIMQPLVFREAK